MADTDTMNTPEGAAMTDERALDLFSGACGGWSVGLHANGIETVAACEIDPWRSATFARNFPKARMYDDVRSLTADRLRNDLGFLPDVIVGSPPCQDASTANAKGKGVDGERTGLFFDAVRLVREVRPVWACFENVPGLRARGYDRVHAALEEAGYAVTPLVVGAVHAGAPHRRNRVWIVAVAKEDGRRPGRAGRFDPSDAWQPEQAFQDANATLVHGPSIARHQSDGFDALNVPDAPGVGGGAGLREGGSVEHGHGFAGSGALAAWKDWNGGPPDLGRVDAGLPKGMARKMLSAYGDAVVPAVTTAIIRATRHALSQRKRVA